MAYRLKLCVKDDEAAERAERADACGPMGAPVGVTAAAAAAAAAAPADTTTVPSAARAAMRVARRELLQWFRTHLPDLIRQHELTEKCLCTCERMMKERMHLSVDADEDVDRATVADVPVPADVLDKQQDSAEAMLQLIAEIRAIQRRSLENSCCAPAE